MTAIVPVTHDPEREIPGIAPEHAITVMLPDAGTLASYHSRLQGRAWLAGDLMVTWPFDDQTELAPVRQGQTAIVEVWPEHDALYTVETVVKSARREVPGHIILTITGKWQRVQRRESVRFPARITPTSAMSVTGQLRTLNASIRDLSAGGLRLWSGQEIEQGDELRLSFALPDDGPEIAARVTVERVETFSYQSIVLWEAGCTFGDLPAGTRDRIVRYIFAEQRALAQRRKKAQS